MAVNKVKGLLGCSEWDGNREVEISFEESMSTEHSNSRHDEGSTLLPYQARALCVNKHRPELVDILSRAGASTSTFGKYCR